MMIKNYSTQPDIIQNAIHANRRPGIELRRWVWKCQNIEKEETNVIIRKS